MERRSFLKIMVACFANPSLPSSSSTFIEPLATRTNLPCKLTISHMKGLQSILSNILETIKTKTYLSDEEIEKISKVLYQTDLRNFSYMRGLQSENMKKIADKELLIAYNEMFDGVRGILNQPSADPVHAIQKATSFANRCWGRIVSNLMKHPSLEKILQDDTNNIQPHHLSKLDDNTTTAKDYGDYQQAIPEETVLEANLTEDSKQVYKRIEQTVADPDGRCEDTSHRQRQIDAYCQGFTGSSSTTRKR